MQKLNRSNWATNTHPSQLKTMDCWSPYVLPHHDHKCCLFQNSRSVLPYHLLGSIYEWYELCMYWLLRYSFLLWCLFDFFTITITTTTTIPNTTRTTAPAAIPTTLMILKLPVWPAWYDGGKANPSSYIEEGMEAACPALTIWCCSKSITIFSSEWWRANACHITGVQESTCSTIFAWVSVCARIVLVNLTVSASKVCCGQEQV